MSRRLLLLGLLAAIYAMPSTLLAQRARFGIAVGKSFVGGGDSRTLIDAGSGFTITGADQAGLHIRGMAEMPLHSDAFTFRGELFYNVLHSSPNSYAIVGNRTGAAALYDRTYGLTGTFVASLSQARVSPYFLFGGGAFLSRLGANPDPRSSEPVVSRGGMGLGLHTGLGLRVRAGKRAVLLEWRYGQALNNTRGVAFMPLTVGVTF